MLVYGDHDEVVRPSCRLIKIDESLKRLAGMPSGIERHGQLVGTLIEAGQLLQGIADEDFRQTGFDRRTNAGDELTTFLCELGQAVCASWEGADFCLPAVPNIRDLPKTLVLRTPEGFAYYALYPEAYIEAARRLNLAAAPRVIGIRTIGTTLAAVVAAALGCEPPITLRPHGDAFARKIDVAPELERELAGDDRHYIIVDEGPGLSGSSFGAVADWLEQRCVPRSRITFLPSHSGPPGEQASEAHRRLWEEAQCVPAELSDHFPRLLRTWLSKCVGEVEAPLEEISGGQWRHLKYANPSLWPGVVPAWERRKFLAVIGGEKLLVKFAGLGFIGERKLTMARALHCVGLVPEPIALIHGFLVERWHEASAVLLASDTPMGEIAHYIGARARLFPADESSGATLALLLEMCRRNLSLAINEAAAERSLQYWQSRVDRLSRRIVRVRTDNKLDPHEWLRLPNGPLLKTDAVDHHVAHDLIGCQDMAWDVAGAIVEFALDETAAGELIKGAEQSSGRAVDRELLDFYVLAYCCFRIGQARLGAQLAAGSPAEVQRLLRSAHRYGEGNQHLHQYACSPTPRESSID